ncbi:EAL domain-containing protein [Henriciella sp. AS95]|uniref:putative bifunctional diguanylate cyclase/phosphodiesterase n=1 Tax=Henriciella sp. AS95 TaxID=3135782 RepID=UPI00317F308E
MMRGAGWELSIVILACVTAVVVNDHFDLFSSFHKYSHAHDNWNLDRLAAVLITLSVAGFVLATKRLFEVRREFRMRMEAERHMAYLALNDPLTGLSNRRAFINRLKSVLESDRDGDYAVIMLDLDRFKPVNDLHGHAVGDRLLQTISQRLQEEIKPGDMLARLGGDEFAALLYQNSGDEHLDRIVANILRAVEGPVEMEKIVCQVGASAGVSILRPNETIAVESLLKQADMALYDAKENGRGHYLYFDESMNEKALERSQLEMDLRAAVTSDQIRPCYQPLIRLSDNKLEGYEILARWYHPQKGILSPDTFIPIAEDTGLIKQMTLNLLRAACENAQSWPDGLFISLNISPVQLRHEEIVDDLLGMLEAYGHPPSFLEVEVTENALIDDMEMATVILERLADSGIRLALDDFGTGYASLNQLRSLPFDKLKIDKSFIMSMSESEDSRTIVNAVLALSQSLGLESTAEGIESEDVADWLKAAGCGHGQGYYFGRPDLDVVTSLVEFGSRSNVNQLKSIKGDLPSESLPAAEKQSGNA